MSDKSDLKSPTLAALLHLCKLTQENNELLGKIQRTLVKQLKYTQSLSMEFDDEPVEVVPKRASKSKTSDKSKAEKSVDNVIETKHDTKNDVKTKHENVVDTKHDAKKDVDAKHAVESKPTKPKSEEPPLFFQHTWSSKEEEEEFMREYL